MIDHSVSERLEKIIIQPDVSIAQALARIDAAGTGAIAICTAERALVGLLTDGDIRRAVLRGVSLDDLCVTIANRNPVTACGPLSRADALHLMSQYDISHLPVVDQQGILEEFLLRKELVDNEDLQASRAQRLESVIISPDRSITEAIAQLDSAGTGGLAVCVEGRRLIGLLTDGDIRRAVLRGISLDDSCGTIAISEPIHVIGSISARDALENMTSHDINHLPVVDANGNLVDFLLRRELIDEYEPLTAVIMAGGLGMRLRPLTEHVPKPMLPIGGRPLLERTISRLRRSGIRDVCLTTHYLPERIVEHFGDGKAFGVTISYASEEQPLGTAGGLKLIERPNRPFLVINGDILTEVPFQEMLAYHQRHGADMTVGVRKYEVEVPFGVIECDDVRITGVKEKPSFAFFINAGVYLMDPAACDYIPDNQRFDMTDLISKLLAEGRTVVSFPIVEYWRDVGRPDDYGRAERDVSTSSCSP